MAWFKRRDKIIDLSQYYKKPQEKVTQVQEDSSPAKTQEASSAGMFNFFGTMASANKNSATEDETIHPDDKRRRLAKRIMEVTEKIEELSNQIYHLQQRIEVLERKTDINRYE